MRVSMSTMLGVYPMMAVSSACLFWYCTESVPLADAPTCSQARHNSATAR